MDPQPTLNADGKGWTWQHKTGPIRCASGDTPSIYGKYLPGEQLWVRETWSADHAAFYPNFPVVYKADMAGFQIENGKVFSPEQNAWYPFRWRPSIHMPRWASRITLEVVSVRVERVQEISEADAKAEGVTRLNCGQLGMEKWSSAFRNLWIDINGHDSWEQNPVVWVVEFRRIEP